MARIKSGSLTVPATPLQTGNTVKNLQETNSYIDTNAVVTWSGTTLACSSNGIRYYAPNTTGAYYYHAIPAADSPITIADGSVLVIFPDLDTAANETLASIAYGSIVKGKYSVVALSSLAALTPSTKDHVVICYRTGSDLIWFVNKTRWLSGTSEIFGVSEGSAVGAQVGYARATTGARVAITQSFSYVDTVPTDAAGDDLITVAYTPKRVGNKLLVRGAAVLGSSNTDSQDYLLFINYDTAAAIAASYGSVAAPITLPTHPSTFTVGGEFTVDNLSSKTWRLQAAVSGGTGEANADGSGSRRLGGVGATYIEIVEIQQ